MHVVQEKETMNLDLRTHKDFSEASFMLYDATITLPEISYNPESKQFSAIFNRRKWEECRRRGIFRRMKMKVVHSKLILEDVASMEIENEKVLYPTYEVNCVEVDDLRVSIIFHNDAVIRLKLLTFNGKLQDSEEAWEIAGPISLSFGKD
jgi:hypothetical protein